MKYITVIFLTWIFLRSSAIENDPVGARSAGMANASVVLNDIWSAHHNQAGMAFFEKPVAGFYFERRFSQKELSLASVAGAYPVFNGVLGFNLTYWGYENFNTTKFAVSFSKKLGERFSAGIQFDYLNTYLSEEYGNKGSVIAEAGIRAEPIDNLFIGAHIYNPTRAKLAEYDDERLPTIMRLGIGYRFSEQVLITLETEKNINEKIVFKTGLEYKYMEKLFLRVGVATDPVINTFGLGYAINNIIVDLAFSRHPDLGYIPHFSVNYSF